MTVISDHGREISGREKKTIEAREEPRRGYSKRPGRPNGGTENDAASD